jgi:ribosomal protein S12 methylthiotransferase accessory factor
MEAAEGYHAERISLPLKLGSYADMTTGHRLVDIDALPRRTNSTYHPDLPLLWIEGYDLMQREVTWVPYELIHTNYTVPLPQGSGCFVMSSNGLASGNHVLEAISHAICEAVERDSTTLWELSGDYAKRKTRLDLSSVDHPACREVLERYERAGLDTAVYETTSDIGLAAFLCAILERDRNAEILFPSFGMGCHPAREVALLRALTEAAQSRLGVIAGSRDDIFTEDYENMRSQDQTPWIGWHMGSSVALRKLREIPTSETETFEEDIKLQLKQLYKVGIE